MLHSPTQRGLLSLRSAVYIGASTNRAAIKRDGRKNTCGYSVGRNPAQEAGFFLAGRQAEIERGAPQEGAPPDPTCAGCIGCKNRRMWRGA